MAVDLLKKDVCKNKDYRNFNRKKRFNNPIKEEKKQFNKLINYYESRKEKRISSEITVEVC